MSVRVCLAGLAFGASAAILLLAAGARRMGAAAGALMRRGAGSVLVAVLAFLSTPNPASAVLNLGEGGSNQNPTGLSLQITMDTGYSVTDIVLYTVGSPSVLTLNPTDPWTAFYSATTPITVSFLNLEKFLRGHNITWTPGASFLIGLADYPAGNYHMVLFTNTGWAGQAIANQLDFDTIFPDENETQLEDDFLAYQGGGSDLAKVENDVFTFGAGDAVSNGYGSIEFAGGDNFDVVSFSTGQIIGSGTSTFTYSVPEPSTWAMLGLGFMGLGFMAYRGRARFAGAAA